MKSEKAILAGLVTAIVAVAVFVGIASRSAIPPAVSSMPSSKTSEAVQPFASALDRATQWETFRRRTGGHSEVELIRRLREWEAETNAEIKERLLKNLMDSLTSSNAVATVQSLPAELLDSPFGIAALNLWVESDRKAAADWMATRPVSTGAIAATIAHDWWLSEREEFQTYCDQLPDGEWKQKILGVASYESLASVPMEAIAWARQMAPGDQQAGLLQAATAAWTRDDPEGALEWLAQINDPQLLENLIGAATIGYAEIDPRAAAEWLVQSVQSEEVLKLALRGIVQAWAVKEPAAVGEWVAQFPQGPEQQIGLENLLNTWGANDVAGAVAWVAALPKGPLRSQANEFLVKNHFL
ncbi:MAG: hypothetical protein H7Y43_13880 [Akkermansiaceae bacterium]|nr:hypothetical protein [Verrucomicrobiales bacterium]